jgi:hypothetical protein
VGVAPGQSPDPATQTAFHTVALETSAFHGQSKRSVSVVVFGRPQWWKAHCFSGEMEDQ